jgi:hypothetical protein
MSVEREENMIRILSGIVLLLTCTVVASGQAVPVKERLTIVISTEKSTFKAADPLPVKIELTNTSSDDLDISGGVDGDTGIRSNHLFEIRDAEGGIVPRKPRKQAGPLTGSAHFVVLKPGETSTTVEDLGRAYDMAKPGKYTIQMSRPVAGTSSDEMVKSNEITVTVAPAESQQ